jgi:hypothetical protein
MVDGEAFVYTTKNESTKSVTGITRAAKGTSPASHLVGTTAWWVQHDVYLVYDAPGAGPPAVDDNFRPAFDMGQSTNNTWRYEDSFGEDDGLRTASWSFTEIAPAARFTSYVLEADEELNPWLHAGVETGPGEAAGISGSGRIWIYNPCGITAVHVLEGLTFYDGGPGLANLQSSNDGEAWSEEYSIPASSALGIWAEWARDEMLASGATHAGVFLAGADQGTAVVEVVDVELALNVDGAPVVTVGSEYVASRLWLPVVR